MRKNIFWMVCCFSMVPAFVCAAPSTNDLSQACYRQFRALSDVRLCAEKKFEASERLLVQKEQQEPRMLDTWFEEEYFKGDARRYMPISNREFEKYKNKYCDFSMSVMGDAESAAHEVRRLSCLTSLNLQYIAQLTKDLAYTQRKLE
ncbi:lysozyme inhibitor LprI family protein [Acetobacter papayae]|uniref:lysozyme inhibitor LprI family protein n=1 Tax=Acetobacter papayae TaxID=1076592 RepID=UPI0011DDEDFC|nr:lysozyme inhibitor LprI family protein [Acetobacter papayae]